MYPLNANIFEGLVRMDPSYGIVPVLARSWTREGQHLALRAARGREVPRRPSLHGRGGQALVRPHRRHRRRHAGVREEGHEDRRRLHGRGHAAVREPAAGRADRPPGVRDRRARHRPGEGADRHRPVQVRAATSASSRSSSTRFAGYWGDARAPRPDHVQVPARRQRAPAGARGRRGRAHPRRPERDRREPQGQGLRRARLARGRVRGDVREHRRAQGLHAAAGHARSATRSSTRSTATRSSTASTTARRTPSRRWSRRACSARPPTTVKGYAHDPAMATQLLEDAGWTAGDGRHPQQGRQAPGARARLRLPVGGGAHRRAGVRAGPAQAGRHRREDRQDPRRRRLHGPDGVAARATCGSSAATRTTPTRPSCRRCCSRRRACSAPATTRRCSRPAATSTA